MSAAPIRALHVNDAAFTTTVLLAEARRRGLPWGYLQLAVTEPSWRGFDRFVRRGARGLAWEARLALAAAHADLLHVHVASVERHTGWLPRPYVLHLHGTDARTHQYDPRLGPQVRRAIDRAAAVLYSTPDLAPHVRRDGAELLPSPIDTAALPPWGPAVRPRVVFPSRWSAVKGLDVQLAVVRHLRDCCGQDVDLVGINWGEGAPAARTAGVRLVERLPHVGFQQLLSTAHVAVGQPTGMLAVSELEALGIGVPVVAPLNPVWYNDGAPVPPVAGGLALGEAHALPPQDRETSRTPPLSPHEVDELGSSIGEIVLRTLEVPALAEEVNARRLWVASEHGVERAVDRLVQLYERIMDSRRH